MAETITITLDTKAQTGGINTIISSLGQVKQKAAEAQSRFGEIAGAIKSLLAPVAAILTAGALIKLTKDAIDNADAMGKMAQKAGLSVDVFSALAATAHSAGISSEELISASKGLGQWMQKSGQFGKDLNRVILEQSDLFSKMPEGLDKVRLAQERFGKIGQQLIPLLNQGSAAIREQMAENEAFGNVVGPRFSARAQQFNDNLGRIHAIFQGMFNLLSDAVLPVFNKLLDVFINWVKETGASRAIVQSVIDLFQALSVGVLSVATSFQIAGSAAGTFFGALFETGSFGDAYDAMLEDVDKRFGDFKTRAREIMSLGIKPDKGVDGPTDNHDSKAEFESEMALNDLAMKKLDLAREELTVRGSILSNISQNGTISRQWVGTLQQEADQIKKILQTQLELNKANGIALIGASLDGYYEEKEFGEKLLANSKERLAIEKQVQDLKEKTNDFTFVEKLSRNLDDIGDQFRHLGASIADVLTNGIKGAIDTVSKGIWQVIDGTATWGTLFRQVGRDIISSLLQIAIQEILVANIKKGLAMAWKAFTSLMRTEDIVEANATEAAKVPGLTLTAVLASLGSWGVAAIVGLAIIGGILAAVGAFEQGGVVHGGEQIIRVNEGGKKESVLNARATALLGEERINQLNAGLIGAQGLPSRIAGGLSIPMSSGMGASERGSQGSRSSGQQVNILMVDSRNAQAAKDFIESSGGQVVVANAVRNQKTAIGMR